MRKCFEKMELSSWEIPLHIPVVYLQNRYEVVCPKKMVSGTKFQNTL